MIKIAIKNSHILKNLLNTPIIRHFFILKIQDNLDAVKNDQVIEKLFTDIYVENKTSKKTSKGRFADLDEITSELLNKEKFFKVHDLAVSSGITSIDLFEKLKEKDIDFSLFVSDKYSKMFIKKGHTQRYFDVENNLTFGYWGCFFAADKNIFFPLTVLLFHIMKRIPNNCNYDNEILFFHTKLLKMLHSKRVNYIDFDVFTTTISTKFNFVRCMNLLNLGYFNEQTICKALVNLSNAIDNKGILLIGRTNSNGVNNASFFKKEQDRFILLKDVNGGSEIKRLILSIRQSYTSRI